MVEVFKGIAESGWFSKFIITVIVGAGVLVGIQTYPSMVSEYEGILNALDSIILWIFVAEVVVKIGAEGSKPFNYFKDPWNIFDFSIVAVCFLPLDSSFVAVLRLARILRVLKLVTAIPKLQLLVAALLKSIPSMGYVSLLLGMLFYIYACMGVTLYGANDPHHFGNLEIAMLSHFRVVTLEDWTDLMYIAMYGCANYGYDGMQAKCVASSASPIGGAMYFVSFVLFGTMIVLNLFIGVIMNGMDEAKNEQSSEDGGPGGSFASPLGIVRDTKDIELKLGELLNQVSQLKNQAETLSKKT